MKQLKESLRMSLNESKKFKEYDEHRINEARKRCYTYIFIDMHGDEQCESFYDVDESGAYRQLLDMFDVHEVIDVKVK